MNLASLRAGLQHLHPQVARQHPMMHDATSVAVLAISVIINILNLLLVIVKIRHVDYPVPVHYLSLVGFDQVGSWFQNYRLAVFAIVVTLVNGLLAAKSFQRNRLVSFFLLIGSATVAILCLVISSAFAVIV